MAKTDKAKYASRMKKGTANKGSFAKNQARPHNKPNVPVSDVHGHFKTTKKY